MKQNIFDMADALSPKWAVVVRRGREVKCRLRVRIKPNDEIERTYEWMLDGKIVDKNTALFALR